MIFCGDAFEQLQHVSDNSVQCCVTSPPYWKLKDYNNTQQLGQESTVSEYVQNLVRVFTEVYRVLKGDGCLFLNLGDTYFSGGRRGVVCGTSGKEQPNYLKRGCFCENLCDVCLAAFLHSPHTFRQHVSMLPPLPSLSNPEHMATLNDRVPTLDSVHHYDHTLTATLPIGQNSNPVVSPVISSHPSNFGEFSQPHPATNRQLRKLSASQDVDFLKTYGESRSGNKKVCICGTALPLETYCRCTSGKSFSVEAYPYLATPHLKSKDLAGVPWRVAFALQEMGWYLRADIIWNKPNPTPESVKNRPTKAHEYIFLLTKSRDYYYNADAIREPLSAYYRKAFEKFGPQPRSNTSNFSTETRYTTGTKACSTAKSRLGFVNPLGKNKRSVWTVPTTKKFNVNGKHFATYPDRLIEPCILAGSQPGDMVLDPFCGIGTTGRVALQHGRVFTGIELNPEYAQVAECIYQNSKLASLIPSER